MEKTKKVYPLQDVRNRVEDYLRRHTREGDCPCKKHQSQMRDMATDIVKIALKPLRKSN